MIVSTYGGVIPGRKLEDYAKLVTVVDSKPRHAEHHRSRTRQITRHTVQILAVRRQPRLELDERGRAEAARTIARERAQVWT